MDLKEKIKVMQAFDSGSVIESSEDGDYWREIDNPSWNWDSYVYRIKPEAKLKPCPFCGSKLYTHDLNGSHDLQCKNTECLLYHGLEHGIELEQIMKQWSE